MTKLEFSANVQSKDKEHERKTIELSSDARKKFEARDHVRITIKKKDADTVSFYGNIQSKTIVSEGGRKLIELPPVIRHDYKVGDSIKITIEST